MTHGPVDGSALKGGNSGGGGRYFQKWKALKTLQHELRQKRKGVKGVTNAPPTRGSPLTADQQKRLIYVRALIARKLASKEIGNAE